MRLYKIALFKLFKLLDLFLDFYKERMPWGNLKIRKDT